MPELVVPECLVPSAARFGIASALAVAPGWVRELIEQEDERAAVQLDAMALLLRPSRLAPAGQPVDAVAEAEEEIDHHPDDDDDGDTQALADIAGVVQCHGVVLVAVGL